MTFTLKNRENNFQIFPFLNYLMVVSIGTIIDYTNTETYTNIQPLFYLLFLLGISILISFSCFSSLLSLCSFPLRTGELIFPAPASSYLSPSQCRPFLLHCCSCVVTGCLFSCLLVHLWFILPAAAKDRGLLKKTFGFSLKTLGDFQLTS